jgi:predicted PhzF superfamily epimerase YddE/YHI9
MKNPIYQADAFTDHVFGGNPAAVCPLENWLPDEVMQNIAAENNLAETAFFVEIGDHSYELRWFTPKVEVDLCGHATLASAHILFTELGATAEALHFHTKSGELIVRKSGAGYEMDFPADDMPAERGPLELYEALGAPESSPTFKTDDYMVVLDSEAQVAALSPDFKLLNEVDARGVIVTAPGDSVDLISRFFAPQVGIDEDPVTGSAHTKLAPYWARRLGKNELTATQISERVGQLRLTLQGNRVLISGEARTYLRGEIEF